MSPSAYEKRRLKRYLMDRSIREAAGVLLIVSPSRQDAISAVREHLKAIRFSRARVRVSYIRRGQIIQCDWFHLGFRS